MASLIIKMVLWLTISMGLGAIIAWFLLKIDCKKRTKEKEDSLSAVILERNNMIEKLEKRLRYEKRVSQKLSDQLKRAEEELLSSTSLITTLQNRFDNLKSVVTKKDDTLVLKEQNFLLLKEIDRLKNIDSRRVKELEGFENTLIIAEKRVQEIERDCHQVIKTLEHDLDSLNRENLKSQEEIELFKEEIGRLKRELKLYKADRFDEEFIISKDQFTKIEEQLIKYQGEIEKLKAENRVLLEKIEKNCNETENSFKLLEERSVNGLQKESDESRMVKVFRETYKKITKP